MPESYALQIDPGLQNVRFPNEAPRGVALKPAAPPTPPEPSTRGFRIGGFDATSSTGIGCGPGPHWEA